MFFFFSVPEIWKTGLTCLIGLTTLIGIMTRHQYHYHFAVAADLSARNCEPGSLVHLWVYRRNVYCGPGDRGYGADNHIWKLANSPIGRHQLRCGDGRDGWSSSGNEPD